MGSGPGGGGEPERWLREAIRLARTAMRSGRGGPFGAVVVRGGRAVGRGRNEVTSRNDPTAHAEVIAIRSAARRLGRFRLDDCVLYASSEPCPMCLGAILWARIPEVRYGATRRDAARAGFDDARFHRAFERGSGGRGANGAARLQPAGAGLRGEACQVLEEWSALARKVEY